MKFAKGDTVECRWGLTKGAVGVVTDISVDEPEELDDEPEDPYVTYEVLWEDGQFAGAVDMWYEDSDLLPYVNASAVPEEWA